MTQDDKQSKEQATTKPETTTNNPLVEQAADTQNASTSNATESPGEEKKDWRNIVQPKYPTTAIISFNFPRKR